ncbi:hypothetical protein QO002_005850 [Pararhizobium capsulatum DSM 1112]|uniref:Lectin-like protein BA14k n=1 Tax=Pararhizobium capsulatum DSM 1112 TaxID=1121113 RepID=A0ABU0BZF6_9HYPH|nr:hypothetical protein [Pararhizobium capsulatum DSM 1112]
MPIERQYWPLQGKVVKQMRLLAIIGLSLTTAFSSVAPAHAFPAVDGPKLQNSDIQVIRNRGNSRYAQGRNYYRRSMGMNRWSGNNARRYSQYHGGYRRYYPRHYYNNYNNYNNYGAPWGSFGTGVIVGGLLAHPGYYNYSEPGYYGDGSHANWCHSRYRSYRAYDDTFQPYYGPRRLCISPY